MFNGKYDVECNHFALDQVQIGEKLMHAEGKKLSKLLLDNIGNGIAKRYTLQ